MSSVSKKLYPHAKAKYIKEVIKMNFSSLFCRRQFDIGISLEMGNLAKDCDKKKK